MGRAQASRSQASRSQASRSQASRSQASRSQASIELLFSWGLVLLLFTALMGVYLDKAADLARESEGLEAREMAGALASAANSVHLAGPGAKAAVWAKPSLKSGENYTLRILGNRVEANWSRGLAEVPLLFSDANSTGNIPIATGTLVNFSNMGGVVYVFQQ